jgi:signal transduction histidine kinase
MKLSQFIQAQIDLIVADWEDFARALPAGRSMTPLALRDHGREILLTIAREMDRPKTDQERTALAEDVATSSRPADTPAAEHGALRQMAGFDLVQLFAEFRALRSSVMLLWKRSDAAAVTADSLDDILRFNEGMDKALAESVQRYSSEVSASRDMFLAVLGHDLRGPLSGITISTLLLSKPGLDDAARYKAAARIKRASTEMRGLITDLLEYTRTRLGAGMPMELADVDAGAVCEDALEAIRTGFPEHQFTQTLSGDLTLQADGPRLHQALANLLANAVQHGDRERPITLSAAGEADTVVLQVGNAGEPIAEDALRVIFEPLVRAPSTAAQSHERSKTSLGLGLFIVREIAIGHGGTVDVQSSAEAGTVFTLRLPRRPPEHQAPQRPEPASATHDAV